MGESRFQETCFLQRVKIIVPNTEPLAGGNSIPPASQAMSAASRGGDSTVQPHTFRIPRPKERDPFFGGARTFWLQLVLPSNANGGRPPVRSVVMKKRGTRRGTRFVLYASALAYFRRVEETQNLEVERD